MEIELYKYNGLPQVINKTLSLIAVLEEGSFRQPYTLMDTTLTLAGNNFMNYFKDGVVNYIKVEDKYYYMIDWTIGATGAIDVSLHLDVLMTYKNEIGKMKVMLERSTNTGDPDIVDNMIPMSSGRFYHRHPFPFKFSEDPELGTYILTTAQRGYSYASGEGEPGEGGSGGGDGGGTRP